MTKAVIYTLDGSTWKDDDGATGEFAVSGDSITLYAELTGKMELASGTVKGGVLTWKSWV